MLTYCRWVLVHKRDPAAKVAAEHVPDLPKRSIPRPLGTACPPLDAAAYDDGLAGSPFRFDDYDRASASTMSTA